MATSPPAQCGSSIRGGDPRFSTDRWDVKQEQAQAAAERLAREEKEWEAKVLENYHGPLWWEGEHA